jgi:fibronectin-binding autotransporter adhesin
MLATRLFFAVGIVLLVCPRESLAQTDFFIGTEALLRDAIFTASNDFADNGVVNNGPYSITLVANITLTQSLPMIRTDSPGGGGPRITIDGAGFTIDADNTGRVFFIERGRVLIQNVTINNARAAGGKGGGLGLAGQGGGGGGGLGAGAAVFADDDADVTLRGVTIGDAASAGGAGGNGGNATTFEAAGGAGGGLGGDGGNSASVAGGGGGGYAGNGGAATVGGGGGGGGGGEFGLGASSPNSLGGGSGGGGQRGNGGESFHISFGRAGGGGGGATANGSFGDGFGGAGGGAEGGAGGNVGSAGSDAVLPLGGGGGGYLLRGGGAGADSGGGGGTGGSSDTPGGAGGIGGGGGGASNTNGGAGGRFGGGGATSLNNAVFGGAGGFGGGGGGARVATSNQTGGVGGFGGGGGGGQNAGAAGSFGGAGGAGVGAGGGGGGALGGAVFVATGAALAVEDTTFNGTYSVTAGAAGSGSATAGQAVGALGFLMAGTTLTTNVGAGNTRTLPDVIAGDGALTKTGAGTLVLTANNTYDGPTTVSAGTLRVNGTQTSGSITVQSGATLAGTGTVGIVAVHSGGTLAPGASPGVLTTGLLHLSSGSTLAIEINGATAGTQYDRVNVNADVLIGGASLSVTLGGGFVPALNDTFTVMTSTLNIASNFNGLPEGSTFTASGRRFRINYDTHAVNLTVVNDPPTITAIGDQTINEDTAAVLNFNIGDLETAGSLTVSATSSNQAIVPNGNIMLGGSGMNRSVSVTPLANQNGGPVTITVTVSDGVASVDEVFTVTIDAVNDVPTISDIGNQAVAANTPTGALAFTVGDVETAAAALTLMGTSSNQALVPNGNIVFGGAGATRTVTVMPAANQSGTALITVTVSDGTAPTTDMFTLTVAAPPPTPPAGNTAPIIGGLTTVTMNENATAAVTFTIADDATAAGALAVGATSSNQALVPASALALSSSGATRTLTITPVRDRRGQATITITASDGTLQSTATFALTVTGATSAPGSVQLAATATGSVVTLAWTNPAGTAAGFYVIEGGTASGATTLPTIQTDAAINTWTLTLPAGTYYFRVRSGNHVGTSGVSNEASATVVMPALPTDLPGPPSGLAVAVAGRTVTISWQPPVIGGPVRAWNVDVRSTTESFDAQPVQVGPQVFSVSGTLADGGYIASVRGVNEAGAGAASNDSFFRIGEPPPTGGGGGGGGGGGCAVPDAPVLLPGTLAADTLTLTWRAPGNAPVRNYRLFAGTAPGLANLAVLDVGAVTAFLTPIPPGLYHVSVQAMNDCGSSAPSNNLPVQVSLTGAPATPSNVRAMVNGTTVTLSWDAVPGAASYVIEAGFTPGATNAAFPIAFTTVTAPGVPRGTYYVRVRAVGAAGASVPSAEIVVVVP